MHDAIRNTLYDLFQELLPFVKLIDSPTMVQKEPYNVIDGLPNMRPYDVAFLLGHTISDSKWKTPLSRIGIDVTFINPNLEPKRLPRSLAAHKNEIALRLREGERLKFQRQGKTDKDTKISKSGENIMQNINSNNESLIPCSILPGGSTGSLFNRLMYGSDAIPLHEDDFDNRPHATLAAETAASPKVPRGILERANDLWRHSKDDSLQSRPNNYNPRANFDKRLGLSIATATANHILRSFNKVKNKGPTT